MICGCCEEEEGDDDEDDDDEGRSTVAIRSSVVVGICLFLMYMSLLLSLCDKRLWILFIFPFFIGGVDVDDGDGDDDQ
jgi:hypothetical protein